MEISKYQNGKIYKIFYLKNPNKIYIGSTIRELKVRFSHHKTLCKERYEKSLQNSFYKFFYDEGFEQFNIELIINYPCDSFSELVKKENEIMLEYQNNGFILMNCIIDNLYENIDTKKEFGERLCRGDEHPMKNKFGEENHNFKFGYVRIGKNDKNIDVNWKFEWRENNECKCVSFSIAKYKDDAKILAELYRKKIFPNYINDEIEKLNTTYDEHIKKFDYLKELDKYCHNNNNQNFKFGCIIKIKNINNIQYYRFVWRFEKKDKIKDFCIDKYGDELSFTLANLFRKKTYLEFNNDITDKINMSYDDYIKQIDIDNFKKFNFIKKIYSERFKCDIILIEWIEKNTFRRKSFSLNKYTEDEANKLANEFKDKIFPELIN
jgi:hypothetical protein